MKILVAYYSFEGHTKQVAEELAEGLKALGDVEMFRIEAEKEPPRSGLKYLVGGFNALRQAETELKPITVDMNDYDIVALGTPVWASNPPGVIKTFIGRAKPVGKKFILFAVSGSGNDGKTLKRMTEYLAGNEIIKSLSLKENEAVDLVWINNANA